MAQVHQLQKLTAQTSSRAAQTSTCVLVPSACSLLPLCRLCHPPHFHLTPVLPNPVLHTVTPQQPSIPYAFLLCCSPRPSALLLLFRFFFFHWFSSSCPVSVPLGVSQKLGLRIISFMEVRGKGTAAPRMSQKTLFPQTVKKVGEFWASLLPKQMVYHYPLSLVISRNILTHKKVTESLESPVLTSKLEEAPEAPATNGSTKTHLKMRAKARPTGQIRGTLHADEM